MTIRVADAIDPLATAFGQLGIDYSVVGSVASNAYGNPRNTLDVDVVAELPERLVAPLVVAIGRDYYVDEDAALDAVRRRAMFNVIHLATMLKVDIYVLTDRPFDRASFARRVPTQLEKADPRTYPADTAEDLILHKLEWYRIGGEVSDRQWHDIVGLIKLQDPVLDRPYLDRWAIELGVIDLLERVYVDAR